MIEEVKEYLEKAVRSFVLDPATSDFQEGYQAAVLDIQDFLLDRPWKKSLRSE